MGGVDLLKRLAVNLVALPAALVLIAITAAMGQTIPDHVPPMRFVVVRSSAQCEPTCPEWISAEGRIEADSPGLLKALLKGIGDRKLPVVLDSPGGEAEAAMALGHIIRARQLDTMVAKTVFSDCGPETKACKPHQSKTRLGVVDPVGALCSSACPIVLAGGVRRLADSRAFVGIHRIMVNMPITRTVHGKKVQNIEFVRVPKWYERKMENYFKELNAGTWIVSAMQNTPDANMRYLLPFELMDLNLTTEFGHGDTLTDVDVCKTTPPASNCRTDQVADK